MTEKSEQSFEVKPLLTLAIPTYNRARFLRELLSVLFDQLVAEPRVELIISDNASPDETPALVKEFVDRGLTVRYIRNETNVGSDANFLQCFEQARGKYVWIFGDDDIIVGGSVSTILKILSLQDYGLVCVSSYSFRNDYLAESTSDRFARFAQVVPGGVKFARRVGTNIAFISAMIVNKHSYLATRHQDLQTLVGSNLLHLGWLLPVLASSSSNLYVWKKLVAARGENSTGWGICQVFGVSFKKVVEEALIRRRDIASELQNRTLQDWFPYMIMRTRRGLAGPMEAENMRAILEPLYRGAWRYWTHVYPLVVLPLSLASVWYSGLKFLGRFSRFTALTYDTIFSRNKMIKDLK